MAWPDSEKHSCPRGIWRCSWVLTVNRSRSCYFSIKTSFTTPASGLSLTIIFQFCVRPVSQELPYSFDSEHANANRDSTRHPRAPQCTASNQGVNINFPQVFNCPQTWGEVIQSDSLYSPTVQLTQSFFVSLCKYRKGFSPFCCNYYLKHWLSSSNFPTDHTALGSKLTAKVETPWESKICFHKRFDPKALTLTLGKYTWPNSRKFNPVSQWHVAFKC